MLVLPERLVSLDPWVLMESPVHLVGLDLEDHPVPKVLMDSVVLLEKLGPLDPLERKETLVLVEDPVFLDDMVSMVTLARPV